MFSKISKLRTTSVKIIINKTIRIIVNDNLFDFAKFFKLILTMNNKNLQYSTYTDGILLKELNKYKPYIFIAGLLTEDSKIILFNFLLI